MANIFLKVVNMSISASWIVIAVLLFRLLFKKAPKWINVVLWGFVGLRLIMPFSFESILSLLPSTQTVSPTIMMDKSPQIDIGIDAVNNVINPIITGSFAPEPMASANPLQIVIPIISNLWLLGVAVLILYTIISYLRLKFKIGTAILYSDNIYQSENVASPFVLGIIKPKIYLPFSINDQDIEHVIAHERAHIKRKDYLWKPIGFLLLTLHWFNPLMWLGYVLLCRDIELACDQKVINELTNEQKADYSQALLTCSINRRIISACPLAFGEVSVKNRVKSILNYKKPAFWIIIAAVIVSIALAVCFLTDPAVTTLKNIENCSFDSITESTYVLVRVGEESNQIGIVDKDLLQKLSDIKISKKEISSDRSEYRSSLNEIVLQTNKELYSTTFNFNSDFTEVWAQDGAKPTLSYKVISPKRAKEIFNNFLNYWLYKSKVILADSSEFNINLYTPEDVTEALLNPKQNKQILEQTTYQKTSLGIKFPHVNPSNIQPYNSPKIETLAEKDVFIKELEEHGITDYDITLYEYQLIEKSWLLDSKMISMVKGMYPELENIDLSNWTIGKEQAYTEERNSENLKSRFTAEQLVELEKREIQINDTFYLFKEFHNADTILKQTDEVLKETIEGYYRKYLSFALGEDAYYKIAEKYDN